MMIKTKLSLALVVLLLSCCTSKTESGNDKILDSIVSKVETSALKIEKSDSYPRNITKGKKDWNVVGVRDWTSGFWPGVLWYAYEYSGKESLKEQAERFTQPIEIISKSKALDHDIGFQVYCSFGNGYRLTGNPEYKQIMLDAADTLATLYNPNVGTILSWPSKKEYPHNTIIDNMMNLELLFWAAKNGDHKELYEMAERHAEVTMKYIVRPDYTIYHVGVFDENTGEFIKGVTHQGYADESMWARGQGWGIYGFAVSYRETGRTDFLETSMKIADKFLERLPKDGIPYWDFDDLKIPDSPKDASAAAVAACGMLELSGLVKTDEDKVKYENAARTLIDKLSTSEYLSGDVNEAILLHSTGHHPRGSEIDVPIIYADYYYIEALMRLRKLDEK